ncbi:MAG TPA: DUF4395 domain-containing protein [Solirubrobacteraceae bacterium]
MNEKAARVVAAGVFALTVVTLASGAYWVAAVMAAGFAARVASGPRLSPLGLLATRVIAPRLGAPTLVPGPPKRFAQAIGLVMTAAIALIALVGGDHTLADVGLGAMLLASGLESGLGYCLGCRIFALAMRAGVIPESICLQCADVRLRRSAGGAHGAASR